MTLVTNKSQEKYTKHSSNRERFSATTCTNTTKPQTQYIQTPVASKKFSDYWRGEILNDCWRCWFAQDLANDLWNVQRRTRNGFHSSKALNFAVVMTHSFTPWCYQLSTGISKCASFSRAIITSYGGGCIPPLVVLRLPRHPRHTRMLPPRNFWYWKLGGWSINTNHRRPPPPLESALQWKQEAFSVLQVR